MQLDIARLIDYFGGVNALPLRGRNIIPQRWYRQQPFTNGAHVRLFATGSVAKVDCLGRASGQTLDLNAFYTTPTSIGAYHHV